MDRGVISEVFMEKEPAGRAVFTVSGKLCFSRFPIRQKPVQIRQPEGCFIRSRKGIDGMFKCPAAEDGFSLISPVYPVICGCPFICRGLICFGEIIKVSGQGCTDMIRPAGQP